MKPRLVHHFTIADVGSLVTFRPHPDSIIYELCLPGKVGIIQALRNCSFHQELTVDFNFILKFRGKEKVRKTLSPYVVAPVGYEKAWIKGCAPKRTLVIGPGDTLTREQIEAYNNHFHRYEQLNPNIQYTVLDKNTPGITPGVVVEFDNPDNTIGPTWRVSGDNLLPLPQWIIDGNSEGHSLIAHTLRRGAAPSAGILPGALAGPTMGTESTPSAYYFASPPSVEINGAKLSTNKA